MSSTNQHTMKTDESNAESLPFSAIIKRTENLIRLNIIWFTQLIEQRQYSSGNSQVPNSIHFFKIQMQKATQVISTKHFSFPGFQSYRWNQKNLFKFFNLFNLVDWIVAKHLMSLIKSNWTFESLFHLQEKEKLKRKNWNEKIN